MPVKMLASIIIFFVVFFVVTLIVRLFFDPDDLKIFKLKIAIQWKYHTKVEFRCKTKLNGTYYYTFFDDSYYYSISEFGDMGGKKARK